MCTQMLFGVQMCFDHDQVQLGHVTMTRAVHIRNPKWPLANFSVFQVYLHKYGYYRWVPLKVDFLGAGKSVQLKHYLAYPIIIISLITQRNLAKKIWAKWESGLTAVWLKQDPPVSQLLLEFITYFAGLCYIHVK